MTTKLLGQSKVIIKDGFKDHIRVNGVTEVWFDKETGLYVIRKGFLRTNCVVDKLSEQNMIGIYNKIGKLLRIKGHKKAKATKEDRKNYKLKK